jgi:uncharacterized membrane protein required for colicin V production
MALDLFVLAFLGALAWLGARRGAAESGLRLVGLPIAYACALLVGQLGAAALAGSLGVPGWLGAVVAGAVGFVAVQALVEALARRARRNAEAGDHTDVSRLLGSLFGVARGALLLVPMLWLASFAEGARSAGVRPDLPDLSGARTTRLSRALLSAGTQPLAATGERADRMTARVLADPGESVAALNAIVSDPRMRVLQADQGFWRDVEDGDVARALARPTFIELARDAEVRDRLAKLGLIAESSALDAEQFHDEMASVMSEVGPRLRAIRNDPALEELMADPALRERVQNGDTLALLSDPRIRALVSRASGD